MKIEYQTGLFYPNYPVFVLMARLENEIFATTYSSSYTLDDLFVIGIGATGRTAKALRVGQKLSLNFLSERQGLIADICGTTSGRGRRKLLENAGVELEDRDDIPTLAAAHLTVLGEISAIEEVPGKPDIQQVFIKIEKRLLNENLILDGHVLWQDFKALTYVGDEKIRIYKPDNLPKTAYFQAFRGKNMLK